MNLYRLFAACFLKSDTKGSVIRIRIDMVFQEQFANNKIRYRFRYPNTALYMRPYIKAVQGDEYDILASEEYIEKQRPYFTECTEDAYVEYKALIELTSKFLLPRRSCIFHAVAFCWKGYAWLLTGPSGAGKTTQYKKWKTTYRDEVRMICGDMPLLEWREDGSIWVHPTPWNGKERIQGKISAPLAGIVILEQHKMNSIERMVPNVSGMSLLPQMAMRPETEEEIILMVNMLNRLLQACPVWKLMNRGDAASALMTANAFDEYLKNAGEKKAINETKGT